MKTTKRQNLLAITCLLSAGITVIGENNNYAPRDYSIVPPAPEAASLLDFKEYPVNYNNGLPDISFPLYTLMVGSIEVPIVLTYHCGGIRVGQTIGNAGLGWSVTCGATIGHTVYGAPDDATGTLHGLFHLDTTEKEFRRRLIEKDCEYDPTDWNNYADERTWQMTYGNRYYQGLSDMANDHFQLYGQGLSATFAFDGDNTLSEPFGKIIVSSDQPISIKRDNGINPVQDGGCDAYGFAVDDNNGLKYSFGTQDRTKYEYKYGNPTLEQTTDSLYYASSWHLDKITDLSGNTVNFTYDEFSPRFTRVSSHPLCRGYSNPELASKSPSDISGLSSTTYYPKLLKQLTGNGITVTFNYLDNGSTISDARLSSIVISAPDGTTRKITFSYYRSYLQNVRDQDEIVYEFDYETEWGDVSVSSEFDEKDFGGYWNHKDNGYSLIPTLLMSSGSVGNEANRSVDPDYATSGTLKRITYPTGGYTDFIWECNKVKYMQSTVIHQNLNDIPCIKIETDTLRYCKTEGFSKLKLQNYRITDHQDVYLDLSRYFNMNPANLYSTAYDDLHNVYETYPELNPPYYPHIVIRNSDDRTIQAVYYLDKNTIEELYKNKPILLSLNAGTYDIELVNPGAVQGAEYFIDLNFTYSDCQSGYIYIQNATMDNNIAESGRNLWCGLRIKRIVSSTGNPGDEPLRKDYYYNSDKNPNETSGTVQFVPKYDYMYYSTLPCDGILGYQASEVYCVGGTAFPNTPLGNYTNIEYPSVSTDMSLEEYGETNSYLHGKYEIYEYSSGNTAGYCDYNNTGFLEYQPIGARMYTSKAHYRGNLLKKTGCLYSIPKHTTQYTYNIYEKDDTKILTTEPFTVCDFTRNPSINGGYGGFDYGIGTYNIIPYNKTIASETYIEEDGLMTSKNYGYFYDSYTDHPDYNLVKSLTTTTSEGDSLRTYYTYMKSGDVYLPLPETEVTICSGKIVSAVRTEYDIQSRLPRKKYTLGSEVGANNLLSTNQATTAAQKAAINEPTYEYKYNSKGNLIEISYRGKPLASYLWGYNGLYPIIEATDVDFIKLETKALESGLTAEKISGQSASDADEISVLASQLRLKLPSSNISAIGYHWLLGVIQMTDSRGVKTSFDYDNRGRLVEVRDFNDYLLKRYTYHYDNLVYE